MKKKNYM